MKGGRIKRRDAFSIAALAMVSPKLARAQSTAIPVIGFLTTSNEEQTLPHVAAFRRGLRESGFVEGRNVTIEYRWAEGNYGRLPHLAAELVRRPVALIAAQAPPAALAAKAATSTVPIVFVVGIDPIRAGLVTSLSRPGGNATGMTLMSAVLAQKRLEMLRELSPQAKVIAMLVNPTSPDADLEISLVRIAARSFDLQIVTVEARSSEQIPSAFAAIATLRPDALLIGTDSFLQIRRDDVTSRALELKIPAIYPFRNYADAGGLISYGTSIPNAYRQAGIYAGRILKGERPENLSVVEPTSFDMVINMKTAGALGLDIPASMHVRADEVIE